MNIVIGITLFLVPIFEQSGYSFIICVFIAFILFVIRPLQKKYGAYKKHDIPLEQDEGLNNAVYYDPSFKNIKGNIYNKNDD